MYLTLLGFVTGILIGLTGTGGGVLLTPLLLLFTSYPAAIIIGTDIINGATTKLLGVFEHRKLDQVRWDLAGFLICGSVPGTLCGGLLVKYLQTHLPAASLDHILKVALAYTLFGVSVLVPFVRSGKSRWPSIMPDLKLISTRAKLILIGALVGFLVALTSIGSGSLLMVFLLFLIPLPAASLVGTDLAFGLATMTLAGSMHLWMGHFDGGLYLRLIVGALPGVVIGSRLTRVVPDRYYSWIFSVLYFSLGWRLLAA
jgi:uncharacterized membrane protein YfcA